MVNHGEPWSTIANCGQPWSWSCSSIVNQSQLTMVKHGQLWRSMVNHGYGHVQPWSTKFNHCRPLMVVTMWCEVCWMSRYDKTIDGRCNATWNLINTVMRHNHWWVITWRERWWMLLWSIIIIGCHYVKCTLMNFALRLYHGSLA